jgi:hypothetical protein
MGGILYSSVRAAQHGRRARTIFPLAPAIRFRPPKPRPLQRQRDDDQRAFRTHLKENTTTLAIRATLKNNVTTQTNSDAKARFGVMRHLFAAAEWRH